MSYTDRSEISNRSGLGEAEQTLRLIASLPAPAGLEDRIRTGLRSAPRRGRVLAWPAPISPFGGWLRAAAAAGIVFVVAGGGWGIYSRVQPGQRAQEVVTPHLGAPGGFSEGGAVRRPQTLTGPVAVQPQQPKAAAKGQVKPAMTPGAKPVSPAKKAAPAAPVVE